MNPKSSIFTDDYWSNATPHVPPNYDKQKHNVVFDHHSHTNYSDGVLTIKQNVEWHIAMGFNAVAITDHNSLRNLHEIEEIKQDYAKKGIIVMAGYEWTTIRIHLNFLGISEWDQRVPYKPKDEKIIEVIDKVHDLGGFVICNHIPWSIIEAKYKNHPSRETLLKWGIDFIEIVNDDSLPENVFDQESYDFCVAHGKEVGMITGTDMHHPYKLASGGVHGWTFLNLKEMTEDAVLDELKKRNTEIVFSKESYKDPTLNHI